jgi:hypothetical protein
VTTPASKRYVWCDTEQKRAWLDQDAADAAIGRLAQPDQMHTYPCIENNRHLHVGHKKSAKQRAQAKAGRGRAS